MQLTAHFDLVTFHPAVIIGVAVSIDFDYFSRHSSSRSATSHASHVKHHTSSATTVCSVDSASVAVLGVAEGMETTADPHLTLLLTLLPMATAAAAAAAVAAAAVSHRVDLPELKWTTGHSSFILPKCVQHRTHVMCFLSLFRMCFLSLFRKQTAAPLPPRSNDGETMDDDKWDVFTEDD